MNLSRRSLLTCALGVGAGLTLPKRATAAGEGKWTPAGALTVGRYAPGAVLLADGRVLVAGGYSFERSRTHRSSDLFDPKTGAWSAGPEMTADRNFPEVLPLPDGGALFVAGYRNRAGTTATTERLEADGARFRSGALVVEERELFAAAPLADGRVLLTGGFSTLQRRTLQTAEIYDPKAGRFTATGEMRHARFGHAAAALPDGRILIVGGKVLKTDESVLPAEIYDPATGTFTETGSLRVGRDRPTAWLLPDRKRVLVAGGSAKEGGTAPARRTELYDLATGRFEDGPELIRDRMAHTATPLGDGRVLLVGGWCTSENATTRQAELWDPAAAAFRPAGLLAYGRHDHAAVRMRDGRVLVAGGKEAPARNGVESPLAAEIWTPD